MNQERTQTVFAMERLTVVNSRQYSLVIATAGCAVLAVDGTGSGGRGPAAGAKIVRSIRRDVFAFVEI